MDKRPLSPGEDIVNTFMQCDGQILSIMAILIDRLCESKTIDRADIVARLRHSHANRSPELSASSDFVFHTLLTCLGKDSGISLAPQSVA